MSTLHHLDVALLDIRERLSRELQFSTDAHRNITQAFDVAHEAMQSLHRAIDSAFSERHRALAAALGNPGPQPETIEGESEERPVKPKLVKAAAE